LRLSISLKKTPLKGANPTQHCPGSANSKTMTLLEKIQLHLSEEKNSRHLNTRPLGYGKFFLVLTRKTDNAGVQSEDCKSIHERVFNETVESS